MPAETAQSVTEELKSTELYYEATDYGVELRVKEGADILVNGVKEKVKPDDDKYNFERTLEGVTKEDLVKSPIRYLLEKYQIWIDIGFDPEFDNFLVRYLGINLDRMRELEVS